MRSLARRCFVLLLWALAPHSHAELWGYVDEKGAAHFATEKLDARYELFYRGRTSLDAPAMTAADCKAIEEFKRTRMYHRIANHPNILLFHSLIEQQARLNSIYPALVKAIVAVESS